MQKLKSAPTSCLNLIQIKWVLCLRKIKYLFLFSLFFLLAGYTSMLEEHFLQPPIGVYNSRDHFMKTNQYIT